eukprot:323697-Chlamydomonas_euryale.AAC.7
MSTAYRHCWVQLICHPDEIEDRHNENLSIVCMSKLEARNLQAVFLMRSCKFPPVQRKIDAAEVFHEENKIV